MIKKVVLNFLFFLSLTSGFGQNINCLDLAGVEFGECALFLGYGNINGQCTGISGCSTEIEGIDYSPFIFSTSDSCSAACTLGCIDFAGIDFGPCDAVLGFGILDGECSEISGCSPIVNGYDFSSYLYPTAESCAIGCPSLCMDLSGIDFGNCLMVLGYSLVNGECTLLSGCSYEVNGVDYQAYFFESSEACENACGNIPCVIPEIINPDAICPANVQPVCGCNGITYINSCEAREFGGVILWSPGACNITGIEEVQSKQISFFPNPADNFISIRGISGDLTISIYSISGKKVLETRVNTGDKLDVSSLKSGMYMIMYTDKNEIKYYIKLLKK